MISVSVCGHDSHHNKPCRIEHRNGLPDYLILLIKSESWFMLQGKKVNILPNTVLLFQPDTYICYGCDVPGYNDDWIHFTLEKSDMELLDNLSLPFETPICPYDFHHLSRMVQLLSNTYHNAGQQKANILHYQMLSFLYSLSDEMQKSHHFDMTDPYYPEFTRLRTQLYNNPTGDWSQTSMCKELCLSTSYFQHLYKKFFDVSCQQDIILARIEYSKLFLTTTDMNIRDIAEFCGYDSDIHYMKQFKKNVGMTPSEFRKGRKKK